jgi:hypothetical protein
MMISRYPMFPCTTSMSDVGFGVADAVILSESAPRTRAACHRDASAGPE